MESTILLSLGLELGGGKSARTSLVVLKYFAEEKKIFLSEIHSQVQANKNATGDETLLALLRDYKTDVLAVHAPLQLAPCISCKENICPRFENCDVPSVKWMRDEAKSLKLTPQKTPTPYTQRPVDLYLRSRVQKDLPIDIPFEETLGAGQAPLAARMQYLKRHLNGKKILETNPRVIIAAIASWFRISQRELRRYRDIEDGAQNRMLILEAMSRNEISAAIPSLFLYNRDAVLLAKDIDAFDAFLSALMPIYEQAGLLRSFDNDYDVNWGTIALPQVNSLLFAENDEKNFLL